jgi:uncharacterized protein YcbK (DUF882 family)
MRVMQKQHMKIMVCSALLLYWVCPIWAHAAKFKSERVQFSVRCNELVQGYSIQSFFVLPKTTLAIEILDADWKGNYALEAETGEVEQKNDRQWLWKLPQTRACHTAIITHIGNQANVRFQAFVLIPFSDVKENQLNGYDIGMYPEKEVGGAVQFALPKGFIEVTEENQEMFISPHFQLRQFLCRQKSDFPKYLVVDERLLLKLESVLAKVNASGYRCSTLSVSSGYRTPYYNKQLGNTQYSAHLWGRAADVYIDNNYDNTMDDLNRNGKSDLGDVKIVRDIVERLERELRHQDKIGGIGIYEETDNHGPFVHIDVRGEPARWEKSKGK